MTTPLAVVKSTYTLPFTPYTYQVDVVNDLATRDRQGHYLDAGVGKTLTSTLCALYKKITEGRMTIVLMPPILLKMWEKHLGLFNDVTVAVYAGTPKARASVMFDVDFVLMSIHVFKRDWDNVVSKCGDGKWNVIVDEATSIKNVESDNHKAVHAFVTNTGASLMLLTGTPITRNPLDCYAYIKMIAPGTYRNKRQFENIHVEAYDFFNNPVAFKNLDLLAENMNINARRLLKTDVLKDLPPLTITRVPYDIEPSHFKLYKKIATEQLHELESGGKIDASNVSALLHTLGQLVLNWGYFSENDENVANGVSLAREVLEEIGPDGKLVLAANYRMSNRLLISSLSEYGAVGVFGDVSRKQQDINVETFANDPSCRVVVIQPTSAGLGIDGWQRVCSDMLILEPPTTPAMLEQIAARLYRNGQSKPVHVRLAVAERTLQVRQTQALLDKEDLISKVIRNPRLLRDVLGV